MGMLTPPPLKKKNRSCPNLPDGFDSITYNPFAVVDFMDCAAEGRLPVAQLKPRKRRYASSEEDESSPEKKARPVHPRGDWRFWPPQIMGRTNYKLQAPMAPAGKDKFNVRMQTVSVASLVKNETSAAVCGSLYGAKISTRPTCVLGCTWVGCGDHRVADANVGCGCGCCCAGVPPVCASQDGHARAAASRRHAEAIGIDARDRHETASSRTRRWRAWQSVRASGRVGRAIQRRG